MMLATLELLLHQAEKDYEAAAETGNFAVVLAPLNQGEEVLRAAQEATDGLLPPDLESLAEQVGDLRRRAEVGAQAMARYVDSDLADALRTLRAATALRKEDRVLSTVRSRLEEEFRTHTEETCAELLRRADIATEASDLTEALDLLLRARELRSTPEIEMRYNQLRRRRELEGRLREAETDYQSKLATQSLSDALTALRHALNALLPPENGLPGEVRDKLLNLVMLGNGQEGLALGREEQWQAARELLVHIGRAGHSSWVAGRAYYFVDLWARLAREVALKGVIASAIHLGNLIEGYRAAAARLRQHPTDEEVIEEHAKIRELLIKRLNNSASKRLSRAGQALADLEFPVALDNLWSLEAEIYGSVDGEFPGLLEGYDEVTKNRGEAESLRARAERLKSLYERVWPLLEDASQALLGYDPDEAERRLDQIREEEVEEFPTLAAQVNWLRLRIAYMWRRKASDVLTRVYVGLLFCGSKEDYAQIVGDLRQFDQSRFPPEAYEPYLATLQFVRQAREALAEKQEWLEMRQPQHYYAAHQREEDARRSALEVVRKLLEYCKPPDKSQVVAGVRDAKLDTLLAGQVEIRDKVSALRQTVLDRFNVSEQTIIGAVVERLDQSQLATTQVVLEAIEAGRVPETELQQTVVALRRTLVEIRQLGIALPDAVLGTSVEQVSEIVDAPKLDVKHKLKVTVPIIPLILSYEGEMALGSRLDLEAAWKQLVTMVRGSG